MNSDVCRRPGAPCLTRRNRISHKLQVMLCLKMCVSLQFHHPLPPSHLPPSLNLSREHSVFGHAWMSIICRRNEMCKWTFHPFAHFCDSNDPATLLSGTKSRYWQRMKNKSCRRTQSHCSDLQHSPFCPSAQCNYSDQLKRRCVC